MCALTRDLHSNAFVEYKLFLFILFNWVQVDRQVPLSLYSINSIKLYHAIINLQ